MFAEALQCATPEARVAYLDAACGTDTTLRRRVEALLRAAEGAGDFLEEPPTGLSGDAATSWLATDLNEKPGERIGRYKLLEKIGEGGCGVVYMAEQEEPVRRRLALKVIKLGMDTKQVIARFEAERQALALMDHPNIAKIFDGGATQTGRPYFAHVWAMNRLPGSPRLLNKPCSPRRSRATRPQLKQVSWTLRFSRWTASEGCFPRISLQRSIRRFQQPVETLQGVRDGFGIDHVRVHGGYIRRNRPSARV